MIEVISNLLKCYRSRLMFKTFKSKIKSSVKYEFYLSCIFAVCMVFVWLLFLFINSMTLAQQLFQYIIVKFE